MDLHCTPSHTAVCDIELPTVNIPSRHTVSDAEPSTAPQEHYSYPDADTREASFAREEQALEDLEAELTEVWGHINAATAHFLALLAEFDRKRGWAHQGLASCAHWLSWRCGVGGVAAREKVRVARALEALPKIAAAFGEGRLSYSKVRAITRVATPETEASLLHLGLAGTAAHIERTVRVFRRLQREQERNEAEAIHERRYLDCRRESDGCVTVQARLAPEVGEFLLKALEAAEAQLNERSEDKEQTAAAGQAHSVSDDVSAETSRAQCAQRQERGAVPADVSAETPRRSACQRRADALGHILERFLAGKCSSASASAHELVVHIAHDALRDVPESSGAALDSGHAVAVETARRLGCDGALVGVVEGAQGEPLAVGRRTRAVPPAIRRALRMRDGGCRFPGCDRSRFVQAHHIRHWADGGETNLDNLITLCSFHHRQVHEGGYGVRVQEGAIEFTHPDGRVIPATGHAQGECFRGNNAAACGKQRVAAFNTARGLAIDAETIRCGWSGERMDYNTAIDHLCWEAGYE